MRILSLCLLIAVLLSSCTVSLILTNTHGTASDVVDSEPTTETKTDADLSIPVKGV